MIMLLIMNHFHISARSNLILMQIHFQDTAGDQCEHCADGFYGDAIQEKNCSPCDCDSWGTVEGSQCDSSTGECNCLPNVVGDQCDTCDEGHWNASFGTCNV